MKKLSLSKIQDLFAALNGVGTLYIPADDASGQAKFTPWQEGMTLTEDEVNTFCLDLPRYKRPRKIIFAPVPRNPTGKIEKPKLRKMYGADTLIARQNGL